MQASAFDVVSALTLFGTSRMFASLQAVHVQNVINPLIAIASVKSLSIYNVFLPFKLKAQPTYSTEHANNCQIFFFGAQYF